jgi:hypothetical protein
MPIKFTDELLVREYPINHLKILGGGILQRGFAELRPRRISHVKMATALIRQMQLSDHSSIDGSTVLMPLQANEIRDVQRHLIDIKTLRFGPACLIDLMANLMRPNEGQAIAILSDIDRPRSEAHVDFARVINTQNPRHEQTLAKKVGEAMLAGRAQYLSQAAGRRKLVIEERPGKASLLDLTESSWKSALRRMQILAARDPLLAAKAPVEAPEGWGLAALRTAPPSSSTTEINYRHFKLGCLSIRMPGNEINLDTGSKLQVLANYWLKSQFGFTTQDLRRLVISDPWLVIANSIATAFKPASSIVPMTMYPDTIFGWQPAITAMEFCMDHELPALAIFTGTYPDVHLMAASA